MTTTDQNPGDNAPSASDFLEFEPLGREGSSSGRGVMIAFVIMAVLAGVGAGVWVYFNGGLSTLGPKSAVPVVSPPDGAAKVRPQAPGGMTVPDRDKLVYGRLDGTATGQRVERLLPPPEAPMEPPSGAITAFEAMTKPQPAPEPEPAPKPKPEPEPAPTPEPLSKPVEATPPPPPAPAPEPVKEQAAVDVTPQAPSLEQITAPQPREGGWRIQMGALKTEAAARAEWTRLTKAHPGVLAALQPDIERADLGERGVFWRLRAGFLADRGRAEALCNDLARLKVACLIVSP